MAYAIVRTGGKQYRVTQGDRLRVERLAAEAGEEVQLTDLVGYGAGGDFKAGAALNDSLAVTARVVRHGRGRKIRIWKFKRRKGYEKRQGHRQDFTELEIMAVPGA